MRLDAGSPDRAVKRAIKQQPVSFGSPPPTKDVCKPACRFAAGGEHRPFWWSGGTSDGFHIGVTWGLTDLAVAMDGMAVSADKRVAPVPVRTAIQKSPLKHRMGVGRPKPNTRAC